MSAGNRAASLAPSARAAQSIATSIENTRRALDLVRRGRIHDGLAAAEAHVAAVEASVDALLRHFGVQVPR